MRSPSTRCFPNTVNVYIAANEVDSDGGPQFVPGSTPTYTNVPCTVQAREYDELVDDQQRITRLLRYKVMFGSFFPVTPRDVFTYMDPQGVSHTLFVDVERDEAGRGAAYTVKCTERL